MEISNIFNILTSSRFADDSIIYQKISQILVDSPFVGYGFGYQKFADFAVYEILSIGGIFGLLIYFMIFFYILGFSVYFIFKRSKEALLLFFIWILLIFASIGAPIITANRISIIIWVITSLLIFVIFENKKNDLK